MTPHCTRGVRIIGWLSLVGLPLLWAGCGESQDKSAALQRSVGEEPEGAPLGPMVADIGILQDATSYSPTRIPGGDPVDELPGTDAGKGGQANAEQQALLQKFAAAFEAGDVGALLALYDPAHVAPLLPHLDQLRPSFEKLVAFGKAVEAKLDKAQAAALVTGLQPNASVTDVAIESVDADHATLAGNPGILIFGPTRPDMQMRLARVGGQWRFQLSKPLEASEADVVLAFHDQMKETFDRLIEWVNQQTTIDPSQLQTAAMAAAMGQPIELPEADGEAGAEKPAEPEPPTRGAPEPPTRGGREPPTRSR